MMRVLVFGQMPPVKRPLCQMPPLNNSPGQKPLRSYAPPRELGGVWPGAFDLDLRVIQSLNAPRYSFHPRFSWKGVTGRRGSVTVDDTVPDSVAIAELIGEYRTPSATLKTFGIASNSSSARCRGGFNGRPLVQWPTRPLGSWALESPGPRGPRKA